MLMMIIYVQKLQRQESVKQTSNSFCSVQVSEIIRAFMNINNADSLLEWLLLGIGEKKVKRIYQALHTPFKKQKKSLPPSSGYNDSVSSSSGSGDRGDSSSSDKPL